MKNKSFGNEGENLAESYLKEKGYEILGRNFLTRFGEIDIIAKQENEIVFVEVKTRNFLDGYSIFESISYNKKRRLIRTCEIWLLKNNLENCSFRIDFIGIIFRQNKNFDIEHIEAAIY